MWEAFLLQMNDFDRFLETELKLMLDPVVARRPPTRSGRPKSAGRRAPAPTVVELAAEAIPIVEPVVTVPVAGLRSL